MGYIDSYVGISFTFMMYTWFCLVCATVSVNGGSKDRRWNPAEEYYKAEVGGSLGKFVLFLISRSQRRTCSEIALARDDRKPREKERWSINVDQTVEDTVSRAIALEEASARRRDEFSEVHSQ